MKEETTTSAPDQDRAAPGFEEARDEVWNDQIRATQTSVMAISDHLDAVLTKMPGRLFGVVDLPATLAAIANLPATQAAISESLGRASYTAALQNRCLALVADSFVTSLIEHGSAQAQTLGDAELVDIGRRAGAQAAAAAAWQSRLGDAIETDVVARLLGGVTRQALDSRKRTGSLFALPGAGTSHYPSWQFAFDDDGATVRPVVLRIVSEFREQFGDVSPFTIAAWAVSPQPELDEQTPADWIIQGGDDAPVVLAARRTAHLEAV